MMTMASRVSSSTRATARRCVSTYTPEIHDALIPSDFGPGGRTSVSPFNCALFGATGFLGRYVCAELGSIGSRTLETRCIVANRGCELETRHLKVSFDLGRYFAPFYSPRDLDSINQCIGTNNVVINMIGKYYETKGVVPKRTAESWRSLSRVNYTYEEMNVEIPRRLARIAKERGVKTFVHVSSILANPDSPSRLARTKWLGEQAVREEFPDATIIRPCAMFGHEDRLLNWYATVANYPGNFVPLVEDGAALVQPVYVHDVAKAIIKVLRYPELFKGKTVELAGPSEYTLRELAEFVYDITDQPAKPYDCPREIASLIAGAVEVLPMPMWVPEDVTIAQLDQVVEPQPGSDVQTFADLAIVPKPVEKIAFSYLHRYRIGGHFILAKGLNQQTNEFGSS